MKIRRSSLRATPFAFLILPFALSAACGDSRTYKSSESGGQGGGGGAGTSGKSGAGAGGTGPADAGRAGGSTEEGGFGGEEPGPAGAAGASGDAGAGAGGDPAGGAAGDTSGAGAPAGASGEAGAAGADSGPSARCDPNKSFGPATYVPSLSSQTHYDASLTADGLTLIVWQGAELATAQRSTADDAFGAPAPDPLMAVAAAFFDQSQAHELPKISGDGLVLYSAFGGQGNTYIYWSKRMTTTEAFGTPVRVPDLEDALRSGPFPAFDGEALYLGQARHLRSAQSDQAGFASPEPLSVLESPEGEFGAVPRHDQLVLYFNSNRSDGTAKGGADVWRTHRSDVDDDFEPPRAVDELNTAGDERPVWVSADDCEIFLIRWIDDNAGSTTPRVMSAWRPR
jgi:hypothetical protein